MSCKRLLKDGVLSLMCCIFLCANVMAESVEIIWDPNSDSDLSGYKVYYGTGSRSYSTIIDVGNFTSYTINNLENGKTYYFAVTAYDFSGNESGFSEEVFYAVSAADQNPPDLAAVVVMGETQIDLIFSEAVDANSAENIANFTLTNGIQVLGAVLDQDATKVHLVTSTHQRGVNYVVSISNVKDLAGNSIPAGTSATYSLPIPEQDTVAPELIYVAVVDETHLDVIFSEPVQQSTAENLSNYSINNNAAILQAQLDANLSVVHLTTTEHQSDILYTIVVNNILDLATTPNQISPNSSFNYSIPSAGNEDATPPVLVSVNIKGFTQLDLNFSEPIEKSSAENTQNYTIDNNVDVTGAVLDPNGTTVHLITTPHENKVTYTLSVENIRDLASVPNIIPAGSQNTYTFTTDDKLPDDPPPGDGAQPRTFVLFQNYPNPFNPETEIRFFLDETRKVSLNVYNTLGQLVKTLAQEEMGQGYHTLLWDGTNQDGDPVPTGVYVYALEIRREINKNDVLVNLSLDRRVKKMTLIR